MSSDLSDVLRDLANDDEDAGERRRRGNADAADAAEDAFVGEIDGEVDDEGGEVLAASPVTRGRPQSATQRKPSANHQLKAAGVPVLITVGVLLLLIGAWGVAVLSGMEIMLSDRPGAERMARAMALVCFPLSFALLAGAAFFIHQLRRSK